MATCVESALVARPYAMTASSIGLCRALMCLICRRLCCGSKRNAVPSCEGALNFNQRMWIVCSLVLRCVVFFFVAQSGLEHNCSAPRCVAMLCRLAMS